MASRESPPKLKVDRVRKSYGPVVALRETTFELPGGEFLALLGPSGSGKTTLLNIVAGLGYPDGGEVWIDGKNSTYLPSQMRDIGMVFQSYALFPHLTVDENVAFPLRMRRRPESEIRTLVRETLDVVRLGQMGNRYPRELSGGQQQRVALARCIVYRPSIILMDEPLGALDRKLRDQMQLEIKQLHTQLGITVLYVTHDQEEAMAMADRICLMNDGGVEQIGSPDTLYFQPRTLFAATFLGDSNILPVRVLGADGDRIALEGPSGARLSAPLLADRHVQPGERASLMVRPERMSLGHTDDVHNNRLEARMADVVMVGGITRHYAALDDGTRLSATKLTIGPRGAATQGEIVNFYWDVDCGVLLPDRGGNT